MGLLSSWVVGAVLGTGWGMLFASWMLPLTGAQRVAATAGIAAVLAVAGPVGRAAAGGFALATGAIASLLLGASRLVLGDAPLAPFAFLLAGAALSGWAYWSRNDRRGAEPSGGR